MIYRLPERISKNALYNKILPDLTKRYTPLKRGENTAVSLVQTKQIDSNALPLFIGMLNLLQNKSDNPVYLELAYNPSFLAFLDTIGFFDELYRYDIIEYDKNYIGGFSDYHYNKENKIMVYVPMPSFEGKPEKIKQQMRDAFVEKVRGDLYRTPFFKIETSPINNDGLWNTTIKTVTELIVNAVAHSGSLSYSYIQSKIKFSKNRTGYLLSVVDVGKGYYASLGDKIDNGHGYTQEDRNVFYQYAQNMGIDIKKEINFLSIMEALYYSQTKTRDMDLFKLKNLLAISNANLRIHQRNREVVFTSEQCFHCTDRDIFHCMECIWKRKKMEKSPIKSYPVSMAGVHIEVEFITGE